MTIFFFFNMFKSEFNNYYTCPMIDRGIQGGEGMGGGRKQWVPAIWCFKWWTQWFQIVWIKYKGWKKTLIISHSSSLKNEIRCCILERFVTKEFDANSHTAMYIYCAVLDITWYIIRLITVSSNPLFKALRKTIKEQLFCIYVRFILQNRSKNTWDMFNDTYEEDPL